MGHNPKVVNIARSSAYVHHRAMLNRRENNIVDALELMRRAAAESPDNREYRLDLAQLYCEIGCHEQSSRLLLDMLAEGDGPAECYYGLALNQLGMNDVSGARRLLDLYRHHDPDAADSDDVQQLQWELDLYDSMTRPASRKLRRAGHVAEMACDAMKAEQPDKACRLFKRSLSMAPEQRQMRALYAMALLMKGEREAALSEAEASVSGSEASVHALCVSAQVFALAGQADRAQALARRACDERPEGQMLRLLIYTLGELRMDDLAAERAREALRETPYDRGLMHIRAVALKRTGMSDHQVSRFWARILRIDPDDTVARYYLDAAEHGALDALELSYDYQVPEGEYRRRLSTLVEHLSRGHEHIGDCWRRDARFRRLIRWSVDLNDDRLNRAAVIALATLDAPDARSVLREMLFMPEATTEMKTQAATVMNLRGKALDEILPASDLAECALPPEEDMLTELPVGERQLVRYAAEVMEREYGVSLLRSLAMLWHAYRQLRGTKADPLQTLDSAAAALAYTYLLARQASPDAQALSRAFGCPKRQMLYYARRMAGCIDKLGERTNDEDS